MKRSTCIALAAILTTCPAWAQQGYVTERSISLEAAQTVARVALETCRKQGHHVTITVLDHAARTKVVLRSDGASPHSLQHSLNKAYTALTFRENSLDWGKRSTASATGVGAQHLDKIATAGGGVPIRSGGEVIGAIGVSGSPPGPGGPGGLTDQRCAQAGIDHIAASLQ